MSWQTVYQWVVSLGDGYGVDPLLFGVIYIAAIPLFVLSLAWMVRRRQTKRSIFVPAVCTSFSFFSSYFYLFAVGENLPGWVYGFVALMIGYGVIATALHVHWQSKKEDAEEPHGKAEPPLHG